MIASDANALAVGTAFVTALAAVGLARRYALRRDVLDHPNERSSHSAPTPRGGGVGLLLGVGAGVAVTTATAPLATRTWLALAGVLLVALIGWRDDHGCASVRLRLGVHVLAGALVTTLTPWSEAATFASMLLALWVAAFTVASVNVTNFIDGIDGMIGTQALVFALHVLATAGQGTPAAPLAAALVGASVGFLAWNWSPARIFLGDVGSGALGALFVAIAALTVTDRRLTAVESLYPLCPIFLDATVTLIRRARRGERLSAPHRSHLYQRLANGGWGHARVTLVFGLGAALATPAIAMRHAAATVGYFALVAAAYVLLDRRAGGR